MTNIALNPWFRWIIKVRVTNEPKAKLLNTKRQTESNLEGRCFAGEETEASKGEVSYIRSYILLIRGWSQHLNPDLPETKALNFNHLDVNPPVFRTQHLCPLLDGTSHQCFL